MKTYWVFLWVLFVVVVVQISTGCSSLFTKPTQTVSMDKFYRRDLEITFNGVTRIGAITMPLKEQNVIHIKSPVDMIFISWQNCLGDHPMPPVAYSEVTEKTGLFGWWTKKVISKREAELVYLPNGREESCPMQIAVSDKAGAYAYANIDFQSDTQNLKGSMICNGEKRPFDGVEICQSLVGLYQVLDFPDIVRTAPLTDDCKLPISEGKFWEFPIKPAVCNYVFRTKDGKFRGRLKTLGYQDSFVRE